MNDFIDNLCYTLSLDIDGDVFYAITTGGNTIPIYVNQKTGVIKLIGTDSPISKNKEPVD